MLLRKIKDTISEGEFGKRGEEYVAAQAAGGLNRTSLISEYRQYISFILLIFFDKCVLMSHSAVKSAWSFGIFW